jgi:hypothetical protein
MNLKRRRGNKSTDASVDASVAATPTAVTPSAVATIASARIAAAATVISGMAMTTEPAVTAAFATGIGASRAVIARGAALPFRVLIAQYDPADDKRPNHDDQR